MGGGASFFRSWHESLPPDVELLAVQYPGREDRAKEPPIVEMGRMADAVVEALGACADEPLVLFGHSMGAAVAYEVALRVGARPGHGLRAVVLSAQPSPRHFVPAAIHELPDDALWMDTMRFNGVAAGFRDNATLRRLLLPVLRSDYTLIETYQPRPGATVDCPVTVCLGDADPHLTVDAALGWEEVTAQGFALRIFPGGDHFYLREEPHRTELLKIAVAAL